MSEDPEVIDTELILHRGHQPAAEVVNLIFLDPVGGTLDHTLKRQIFKGGLPLKIPNDLGDEVANTSIASAPHNNNFAGMCTCTGRTTW